LWATLHFERSEQAEQGGEADFANSVAHWHLGSRVPDFEGTRTITASTAVFIVSNVS
jgi:hypothetical protein